MAIAEEQEEVAAADEATLMVLVMSFDFGKMAEELNKHDPTVRRNVEKMQSIFGAHHKSAYFGNSEYFERNIVIILYYYRKFPTSVFIIYAMAGCVCVGLM